MRRPDPAVVVQIDRNRIITINSQPVESANLGHRLTDIFKSRADKVISVKADLDTEFQYAAEIIDIAQGVGIDKVALLGRQFR